MNAYNIGLKLLGVYFMITGISMIPSFLISYGDMEFKYSISFSLLYPVIMLLSGLFVFFKSEKIVALSHSEYDKDTLTFSNAIQLIGVYLLADSAGGTLTLLFIKFFPEQSELDAIRNNTFFYQDIVLVFIGLLLIVKGKQFATYIKKTT